MNDIGKLAEQLTAKVDPDGHPNGLATNVLFRDLENLRLNSKMLGTYIAQATYYSELKSRKVVTNPYPIQVNSRLCTEADFRQDWFHYWADQLKVRPILHRKVWEDVYVIQCLWEYGMLQEGKSGLGFAVGREALPAYFVSRGALITATDLESNDQRASGWIGTDQHAGELEELWKENLIDKDRFMRNCAFEPADMTSISSTFDARYNFCWSVCAFEHLGSIENGLQFVCNSMKTLVPGGVSVHTTEYNFNQDETIDDWGTVLFQKRHFEDLERRLRDQGDRMITVDFSSGNGIFDGYVDVPPYPTQHTVDLNVPAAPHLRLSVDGFPATSIAIIAIKGS
jgi:hypothetical protein